MRKTSVCLLGLCLAAPVTAQDFVKERLEKSPRHHEWVVVKNGDRKVHCFVVFPEVKDKATAVLVIHENKGLTDWVRDVADQIVAAGGSAMANTDDVSDWDGAGRLVQQAIDSFGRLDVLINNAGILRDRMLVNMSEDEWDVVMRVNAKGHDARGPVRP